TAEWNSFLSLGWQLPYHVLDAYVEFRNLTNNRQLPYGNSLLGALTTFGLNGIDADEKQEMRELAIRGAPFTHNEQCALMAYCQTDVDALDQLLPLMKPRISLEHALLRGRYTRAVAHMEYNGVPIDTDARTRLQRYWEPLQRHMVREIDAQYGV